MQILCGDIGGTNARLLAAEVNGDKVAPIFDKTYPSHAFASFDDVLDVFLQEMPGKPEAVCFAIAGPVNNGTAEVTNLPWTLNTVKLQQKLSVTRLALINDFSAIAHGVNALRDDDFRTLQQGNLDINEPRVFLGAGTGLGVAQSVYSHGQWRVLPSQGGHMAFSPGNAVQRDLLRWMSDQQDYVSNENLLSGKGLANLYRYHADAAHQLESESVSQVLALPDPAAAISQAAINATDEIAVDVLNQFIAIYGAVAGDLALLGLAFGGVYLAGGIAPKLADQLAGDTFLQAFHHKGPMSELMPQFPVHIIMNDRVGLMGAALYAWQSGQ